MTEENAWLWIAGIFALYALGWYIGKALATWRRR